MRDRLGPELLRTNGGSFDVGAIVDLGSCRPVGSAPEVEDVVFQPSRCVDQGYVPPDEFYELCKSKSAADLNAIGPELKRFGRSLTTLEGKGDCSLVFVSNRNIPKLFISAYNKLRYDYGNGIELSVTDVRLYDRKLLEPDAKKVQQLQSRLADCDEFILSIGLGRAWQQPDDLHRRHYLQLNNVHLKTHAGWKLQ